MPHVDARRRNPRLGASSSGLGGNGAASPSAGQRENPAPPKASHPFQGRDQGLAFARAVFERADKNGDGTLTKSEIRKYFKANPTDKVRLIPPPFPSETSSSPPPAPSTSSHVWKTPPCVVPPAGCPCLYCLPPPLVSSLHLAVSLLLPCSVHDAERAYVPISACI
jgi:hypothetical protein